MFLFLSQINTIVLVFILFHLRDGEVNVENDSNTAKTTGYTHLIIALEIWDLSGLLIQFRLVKGLYLSEVKYFMTESNSFWLSVNLSLSKQKEESMPGSTWKQDENMLYSDRPCWCP